MKDIKSVKLVRYRLHFNMVKQIDIIYLAQKVTKMSSEEVGADIVFLTKEKHFGEVQGWL